MALQRNTHLLSPLILCVIIGGLSVIVTSCELSQNASVQPLDHSRWIGCRITSRTVTYTNQTPAFIMKSDWTYNDEGLLIRYANPRASEQVPVRVDYTYDKDGFLTISTQIHSYYGFVGEVLYDTMMTAYAYTDGRLSRNVSSGRTTANGAVTNYEYDQAGELTKIVEHTAPGDTKTYLYSAGKLIDYSLLYAGTNAGTHPYELANGLIVREYGGVRQYYTNYQYDEQGRPTRIERVDNGKVTEYYTYSYTDGKAYFDAIPLPKGWPAVNRKKFI